jgi:hypothetical protein
LALLVLFGIGCGIAALLNRINNKWLIYLLVATAKVFILTPLLITIEFIVIIAGILNLGMLNAHGNTAYIVIAILSIVAIITITIEEKIFFYFYPHPTYPIIVSRTV